MTKKEATNFAAESETASLPRVDATVRPLPVVDIVATSGWRGVNLLDLWAYRELLYILVWRDLKVRYRQTLFGVIWVMGQPLLTMLIFTLIFNRIARIDAGETPYTVFVLTGLLPWGFFAAGVQSAANSLIGNTNLITKVYFPRLLIPTASVMAGLIDFFVAGLVLAGMFAWSRISPTPALFFLPAVVLLAVGLTLGLGLWMAALNVKYRDVRILIPFVLQVWMFATPVVYPLHLLPQPYRSFAELNPMVGVIEGFRWCLLGGEPPLLALGLTSLFALVLLSGGMLFFRRMERTFVDVI
jgi:lipopolysaccharide transport system permease protein